MTRATMICLHGLGASRRSFAHLLATDLARSADLIALDLPGFGDRAGDPVSAAPIDAAAKAIADHIAARRDPVILVGHSMGGAVAIRAATMAPTHVAAVVSIEGNLIAEDCGLLSRRLASLEDAPACEARKRQLAADALQSPKTGTREWGEDIAKVAPDALLAWSRDLVAQSDAGTLLAAFRAGPWRKLYIHGDDYIGHVLLDRLPPIPTVFIPGASHNVMYDAPDATARALATLLSA